MFNFFKKPIVEEKQEKSLQELQLENRIKDLEEHIKSLESSCRNLTFAFDFKTVNVFSIERNWKDSYPCTIIGYIVNDQTIHNDGKILDKQVVKEWYLYCSDDQHEKLVKEFNEFKKGK